MYCLIRCPLINPTDQNPVRGIVTCGLPNPPLPPPAATSVSNLLEDNEDEEDWSDYSDGDSSSVSSTCTYEHAVLEKGKAMEDRWLAHRYKIVDEIAPGNEEIGEGTTLAFDICLGGCDGPLYRTYDADPNFAGTVALQQKYVV